MIFQFKSRRKAWVAAALYFGLILALSSVRGDDLPQIPARIPHLDKMLHFLLYGGLGFLLFGTGQRIPYCLLILAAAGAVDESYQSLIPGRSPDVLDWLADMAGGTLFLLTVSYFVQRNEKQTQA